MKTRDVVEAKKSKSGVSDARASIQDFYDKISRQACFKDMNMSQLAELTESYHGQKRSKKKGKSNDLSDFVAIGPPPPPTHFSNDAPQNPDNDDDIFVDQRQSSSLRPYII